MPTLTEEEALSRAEAAVRSYCGWHVAPSTTETLVLDGPGASVLLLPSLHVTDVESIEERGTLVDPASYEWSESGAVRRVSGGLLESWGSWRGPRWTRAYRGLAVRLTHGYAEMPLDVLAIIERLADRAIASSEGAGTLSAVGAVSFATGSDGLPIGGSLTETELGVLARYKLPPRP